MCILNDGRIKMTGVRSDAFVSINRAVRLEELILVTRKRVANVINYLYL